MARVPEQPSRQTLDRLLDEMNKTTLAYLDRDPAYQRWLEWWRGTNGTDRITSTAFRDEQAP
jgi:hypothetical protein